ncbi:MAG: hypothetical protein HC859_12120, partial [Bacteroidia bacterium]|nr:hypothetical protein [Bacteroidia bacterium]
GHGSAIAQVYNHIIMPLANHNDKETQIIWGIRDFEHRFRRKPEGMWLAETAVDVETLELLASHQIKYTVLAPRQARAFRKIGEEEWIKTESTGIDPRRPYLFKLPSGQSIVLFFTTVIFLRRLPSTACSTTVKSSPTVSSIRSTKKQKAPS